MLNGNIKSIVIPTISMLIGAAVVYGTMKESVSVLKAEAAENRVYVRQIDQRLSRIEGALNLETRKFNKPLGIQNN